MKKKLIKISFFTLKIMLLLSLIAGAFVWHFAVNCGTVKPTPAPTPTPPTPPTPPHFDVDLRGLPYSWLKSWEKRADGVPAGEYKAGDAKQSKYEDRLPAATVNVGEYLIGIYEVTVDDYDKFIQAKGYSTEEWWSKEGWAWKTKNNITEPLEWSSQSGKKNNPVSGVSFYEAEAFCNMMKGNLRLPTEFEWEKAGRGKKGGDFPWGNDIEGTIKDYANVNDEGVVEVGKFAKGKSEFGCFDMVGNVSEWTSTILGQAKPSKDGEALDARLSGDLVGKARIVKGSSYIYSKRSLSLGFRLPLLPETRDSTIGFRVAADSKENIKKLPSMYAQEGYDPSK